MPGTYTQLPPALPLPQDGRGSLQFWQKQAKDGVSLIENHKKEWDRNLRSYEGKTLTATPVTDTVVVPRDFPFVEQKAAQLFFQTPDVHLQPRQDATKDAAQLFQAVVNFYLGEDGVNALACMNEVAFDALCPAGLMISRIGYENFQGAPIPIDTGNQIPDPNFKAPEPMAQLPGSILGIGTPPPDPLATAPMIPEQAPTPNIVYQRYYWERISPACALLPLGFSGSVYDKASWLGFRFEEDWTVLKHRYNLPDDATLKNKGRGSASAGEMRIQSNGRDTDLITSQDRVTGYEIWYKTSLYDAKEPHPLKLRQLIIVDGYDQPLIHRDSPFQKADAQGQLMGMEGFPVHVGALRYVSDSALPPSECTIAAPTNEELNKGRTQMMLQRDRAIPMRLADLGRLGKSLEDIRANQYQSLIGVPNLDPNNPPITVVAQAQYPRENFSFNEILDQDLGQVWAMGQNQRGQESSSDMTATEVSKIDEWATTRLDKERRNLLIYFIGGTRKLASLIQLFATTPEVISIVGADRIPKLQTWDRTMIQGKFVFTIRPDSSIRIDQTQAQQRILKLYEMLGKDPNVRRTELLDEVCRQWNLDPSKIIVPELPAQGPDPASLTMRLDPLAFSVQNPNFPLYYAMMKEAGYKSLDQPDPALGNQTPIQAAMAWAQYQAQIMAFSQGGQQPGQAPQMGMGSPQQLGPGQPEHPGSMPPMDHINKHTADESGDRSGPKVN